MCSFGSVVSHEERPSRGGSDAASSSLQLSCLDASKPSWRAACAGPCPRWTSVPSASFLPSPLDPRQTIDLDRPRRRWCRRRASVSGQRCCGILEAEGGEGGLSLEREVTFLVEIFDVFWRFFQSLILSFVVLMLLGSFDVFGVAHSKLRGAVIIGRKEHRLKPSTSSHLSL